MITTLEIVDIVYTYLNGTALKNVVSGGIYKKRLINSDKEDVIVNSLSVDNNDLQSCIVNVNIYVPNKTNRINAIQDNSQPNYKRLKELATMAVQLLKEQWAADYHFDIQQQHIFEDENGERHFINIRIEFFHINI